MSGKTEGGGRVKMGQKWKRFNNGGTGSEKVRQENARKKTAGMEQAFML